MSRVCVVNGTDRRYLLSVDADKESSRIGRNVSPKVDPAVFSVEAGGARLGFLFGVEKGEQKYGNAFIQMDIWSREYTYWAERIR